MSYPKEIYLNYPKACPDEDLATWDTKEHEDCVNVKYIAASLQQEQAKGIDGVVHHAACAHWIVTDHKKLATVLKEFPEGTEVELFIFARKEEK